MATQSDESYTLFQKDILTKLEDRDWFINCIGHNFSRLALKWDCGTIMSIRRLGEAYYLWREDYIRTLAEGITDSQTLDHFKHASFIAF